MPLPPFSSDGSLIQMERGGIIRSDGRQAPGHRMRRSAMLRRQLVADVVAAVLFLLGLAVGLPVPVLLVLLLITVPVTAVFVIREG